MMDRMGRTLEVRVRTRIPLWVVSVAGLGLSMAAAQGQTTTSPTANPTPAMQSQDTNGSAPAYSGQTAPGATQTLPAPQQAPAPVVTSAPPTPQTPYTAMPAYGTPEAVRTRNPGDPLGSAYIPVDSWIYPAMVRLYSMGYLDTMY
ncbi:MAG: hypothetical protein ACRD4E_03565, partial [Bryobacteraceae bacterium]